jgi:hypothetical protein
LTSLNFLGNTRVNCYRRGEGVALSGPMEVAGDVVAAATTLAGLILVFLAATVALYESLGATFQTVNVRKRYRVRAWFLFLGFALSLFAALFAILGKSLELQCLAAAGLVLFLIALGWVLAAALWTVLEI